MRSSFDYAEAEFEDSMEFFDEMEESDLEGEYGGESGEYEFEGPGEAAPAFDPKLFHPQLGFGTMVSEAEFEEEDQEEEIIGKSDSRSPIKNTTKIPYRYICRLAMTYQDPGFAGGAAVQFAGTGTLIGPKHILTAGHNVRNTFGGKVLTAKAVTASPGQDRSSKPFGTVKMSGFKCKNEWMNDQNPCFDYALLELESSISGKRFATIGNKPLGYWGDFLSGNNTRLEFIDPEKLRKQKVQVAGYPGDKCGYLPIQKFKRGDNCKYAPVAPLSKDLTACLNAGLHATAQFGDTGRMLDPLPPGGGAHLFLYDADTCKGHSGSPVWVQNSGMRYLIGVHTGPYSIAKGSCKDVVPVGATIDANRAVRVTTNMLDNIHKWMGK
ncbi:MAG: hypothetical protein ABI972_07115 [Acidobacteriota bacterium]